MPITGAVILLLVTYISYIPYILLYIIYYKKCPFVFYISVYKRNPCSKHILVMWTH